jgi:hypothetical protein
MVGSLSRMIARAVRLGLALSLVVVAPLARADAALVVTRDDGAAGCPDADEMRAQALAAAPSAPPPTHAYRVSFARSGASRVADVVDDTTARARHLEDMGPGCGPLAQAVAQVLATMWSSERDEASPPPAPVISSPPPEEVVPPAPPRSGRPRFLGGAGPALAVGLVRPAAPALSGRGGIELAHASFGLGALWIPSQRIAVSPGAIDVGLLAGSAWGCGFLGSDTHLGLCAEILAGALHAGGIGYIVNVQHGRPWFAIEPELFVDHSLLSWIRGRLAVGALVPLHAETFSVTGVGSAYATPAVGGLASLVLEIVTP